LSQPLRRLPDSPTNIEIKQAISDLFALARERDSDEWFYVLCASFLRGMLSSLNDSPHRVSERDLELMRQFSEFRESANSAIAQRSMAQLIESANDISALIREILPYE